MSEANIFTDGVAYERLMGRWSRLVGQEFLDWLDALTVFDGSMLGAATAPLQMKLSPAVRLRQ